MRLKARFRKLKKSVNHRKLSVALLIFFSSALMVLFNNCGSKFDTGVRPGEIDNSSFSSEDPAPSPAPIEPPVDPLPDPVISPPPVVTAPPPAPTNPPVVDEEGEILPQETSGRCLPAANLTKLCNGGLCINPLQAIHDNLRCYTLSGGKLKCSGINTGGELGDGTTLPRATAVSVDSAAVYAKVSTDFRYTCGLTRDCTVKCWGSGLTAVLGKSQSFTPEPVDAANAYIDISVNDNLLCAINTAGEIKCWGDNSFILGRTGSVSALTISEPGVKYKSLSQTVGNSHFCAIAESGVLKCWGRNGQGQLGNGTQIDSTTPVVADNGIGYQSVLTVYSASYGITKMGELKFWGLPNDGATYIGDFATVTPQPLDSGTRYVSIAGSSKITCGITDMGQMKCWGGTVGSPMTGLFQKTPTLVDSTNKFVSVAANRNVICGITTTGLTRCAGDSTNAIFGSGQLGYALTPVSAPAFGEVLRISLGAAQSCKINLAGELSCVGLTGLAGGPGADFKVVDAGVSYATVSAGYNYGCAVTNDAKLKCWGNGSWGQLGLGSAISSSGAPLEVEPGTRFIEVSTLSEGGTAHTCAITMAGVLKCWGYNYHGQVGDGTKVNKYTPVIIDPGVAYTNVEVRSNSTCALTQKGEKKCWGLGYGLTPVAVGTASSEYLYIAGNYVLGKYGKIYDFPALTDPAISLSSKSSRSCAVTNAGNLKCWGSSPLGNGTLAGGSVSSPVTIDDPSYRAVAGGIKTSCAILNDNRVKCWGNLNGNIVGIPATTWTAATPITVSAP